MQIFYLLYNHYDNYKIVKLNTWDINLPLKDNWVMWEVRGSYQEYLVLAKKDTIPMSSHTSARKQKFYLEPQSTSWNHDARQI